MLTWLAVGIGGALGSMARHGINRIVAAQWPSMQFPLATTVINVAGCLVFGALAGLLASGRLSLTLNWREFVFVGVLGGFTTFSTFGFETVTLLRNGAVGYALLNVVIQVVGGALVLYGAVLGVERFSR